MYSTVYTILSRLHNAQWTVQCTMYSTVGQYSSQTSVQCIMHILGCKIHSNGCSIYNVQSWLHNVLSWLHNVQSWLKQCTIMVVMRHTQGTSMLAQCTFIAECTMNSPGCTIHIHVQLYILVSIQMQSSYCTIHIHDYVKCTFIVECTMHSHG